MQAPPGTPQTRAAKGHHQAHDDAQARASSMHHGPGDTICLLCGTNSPSPPSGPRTRALGLLIRESCRVSCLTRWRTTLLVPMQEMEQEQEQLPTRALARAALATPPSDTCSRTRPLPACSLGPRGPGGNLTWRQHRLGRAEYRAWFCQQLGIEPPSSIRLCRGTRPCATRPRPRPDAAYR